MKRSATPLPPYPVYVQRRDDREKIYCTDPETGETYYRLRPIEKVAFWVGLAILYVAHAIAIGMMAIYLYKSQNMETSQKTVYIAGPISNIPHGNVVAFADATKAVRNMGHIAKNPHEFCSDIPKTAPWETFIRRGLQQLMDCTDIILLPGWESSDGASLEHMNAAIVGIKIHESIEAFREAYAAERVEAGING